MDENHENINNVKKDTHTNNCFDNTYYNTVSYSHLVERTIEKLVANNSDNVMDAYDNALITSVAEKLNDSKFGSDYTFVTVKIVIFVIRIRIKQSETITTTAIM